MEKNKLVSMTEFVIEFMNNSELNDKEILNTFYKYANFLNKPLTLGIFVPCDEDGNVLIEPSTQNYLHGQDSFVYNRLNRDYKAAKERVLFEGFYLCERISSMICATDGCNHFDFTKTNNKTIESLIDNVLTLTPTALEMIYGV